MNGDKERVEKIMERYGIHPHDSVNHPSHYTDGGIETIDFIRAKLTTDEFRGYCVGNAMKYISRAGKKGDFKTDIEKAIVYLKWSIEHREVTK